VAFGTKGEIHAIALADHLHTKGWILAKTQSPPGFHIAITHANCHTMPQMVKDIRTAIKEIKANPKLNHSSDVALYCTADKVPDKKILDNFVKLVVSENLEVHK